MFLVLSIMWGNKNRNRLYVDVDNKNVLEENISNS
jgi:hypothetical protein